MILLPFRLKKKKKKIHHLFLISIKNTLYDSIFNCTIEYSLQDYVSTVIILFLIIINFTYSRFSLKMRTLSKKKVLDKQVEEEVWRYDQLAFR